MCRSLADTYQPYFSKAVNINLGVLGDEKLEQVFKGTLDEVNNSIIDTYSLHAQSYPLKITKRIPRDIDQKILRAVRIILSTLSRSQHRALVKSGLLKNLPGRLDTLNIIDLSYSLVDTKYPVEDIYKTLAFQMGQTLALIEGRELYTKEDVGEFFPELDLFLRRSEKIDLGALEGIKKLFISKIKRILPEMAKLDE